MAKEAVVCVLCGKKADKAHIRSKGAGGGNGLDDIIPLCREMHAEQQRSGGSAMIKKYPKLKEELSVRGWEIKEVFGLMKLVRK